jgi:transcription termination/antitermination protein NusA
MIQDPKQFVAAINQLCAEKNLPKDKVLESVQAAIKTAYRKDYGNKDQNIQVDIDPDTGFINIYLVKLAVKKVEMEDQEISLGEAKKYKKDAKEGEEILIEVTPPSDFGRIAAQAAKQVILQRIQEAERDMLFETFKERENELVSALVSKVDDNQVFLEIERNLVPLANEERVPGERYFPGTRMKVFLNKVIKTTKGPQLLVSRRHPDLVKKL